MGGRYNLNGMRNGQRMFRLTVGELPKQLTACKIEARKYREAIEDAVLAVYGEVSVTHSHAIDTAAAATMHAGICRWLLRTKLPKMATNDILACSHQILKAKERRDAALKTLELQDKREEELDDLYTFNVPRIDSDEPKTKTPTPKPKTQPEPSDDESDDDDWDDD